MTAMAYCLTLCSLATCLPACWLHGVPCMQVMGDLPCCPGSGKQERTFVNVSSTPGTTLDTPSLLPSLIPPVTVWAVAACLCCPSGLSGGEG